jgi:Protein of unknown function (DUF3237)
MGDATDASVGGCKAPTILVVAVMARSVLTSTGVISTEDGATVLFRCGGYGRAYPPGARQIVCWLTHVSDDPRYRWLNDVVCVGTGDVRPERLVIDVAELIWEPPVETDRHTD